MSGFIDISGLTLPPYSGNTPPSSAYTTQQNPSYGLYNQATGQPYFPNNSNAYVSPATLPQFPIQRGGNHSQIVNNTANKTIFNSLNIETQQVYHNQRLLNQPLFKSNDEKIRYIQAQYTQAIPGSIPGQPTYSINTLFNPGSLQ